MMRAGKDYVAGMPEYEDKRSAHLLELLRTIRAQDESAETEEAASAEVEAPPAVETEEKLEPKPAAKSTNQSKPTLKLTK